MIYEGLAVLECTLKCFLQPREKTRRISESNGTYISHNAHIGEELTGKSRAKIKSRKL